MNRKELVADIQSRIPKGTVGKYDLLPVLGNEKLVRSIVNYLAKPFEDHANCVAAPEALGWILGTRLAQELKVDFYPIRRSGHLPYPGDYLQSVEFVDYSGTEKTFELAVTMPIKHKRVLLVDDWIETGAQIQACIDLLEKCNAKVVGIAAIGIDHNEFVDKWISKKILRYITEDL